jgi:hypothetical protein
MAVFNGDGVANINTPAQSHIDNITGYCIQMSFMEEVQQQSFWARPDRTLKIPQGPVRAYGFPELALMEFKDYLSYRDAELAAEADQLTDPADIALMSLLTDSLAQDACVEAEERPSKVRKVDDSTSSKPGPSGARPIKSLPKCGRLGQRLGQPLIRRFMSKADADAKVMRQESMANAAREEQERAREAAIERAAAEDARRYHAPAPGQKELHDYFLFEGENPHDEIAISGFIDEYVDPATKRPEDLTMADKWTIAEEYICLIMDWEPVQFLAQRQEQPQWRPLAPFDPDEPSAYTQEALNMLLNLRANYPGRSWPERRAMEIAQYEQKREIASRMGMMDELWTLLGYSRILCSEMLTKTGAGPLGIGVANWPAYKPMLDAVRLMQRIQGTKDYRLAVGRGQVVPGATGVGLIAEDQKLIDTLQTGGVDGGVGVGDPTTPRITDFFPTVRPCQAQSLPLAEFPQLTKTATPAMLVRAYVEWVASGADIKNLPQGLHPTRALSKALGGSLRVIMPEDLRVVEWRAWLLEEEGRKARADIAEGRRRRETPGRGSGSNSGSKSRGSGSNSGSKSGESEL